MRAGAHLLRFCQRCRPSALPAYRPNIFRLGAHPPRPKSFTFRSSLNTRDHRPPRLLLAAALSPLAFIELSEDHKDGKSGEEQMLEASREEIQHHIPDDVHGLNRVLRKLWMVLDLYIYEPLATGLRFLHLVVIFVPVIVTIPAVWIGRRLPNKDNERQGTVWWYGFLVNSMERAGPAFIKV